MPKNNYPFACNADGLFSQFEVLWNQGKNIMPGFEREYRFHPQRRWRFDVAMPAFKIAAEYHGGLFMSRRGGHQSVKGTRNDWEKLNEAQILGWIVLQFGPDETRTGTAMQVIERAIKSRLKATL